jgi:hypothetical protein
VVCAPFIVEPVVLFIVESGALLAGADIVAPGAVDGLVVVDVCASAVPAMSDAAAVAMMNDLVIVPPGVAAPRERRIAHCARRIRGQRKERSRVPHMTEWYSRKRAA